MDSFERTYLGIATFLLGVTLCGVLLAELGAFNPYLVGAGGLVALGGFLLATGKIPRDRTPHFGAVLLFLAGLSCYGLVILFPPFNMILGGVDPGVYVNTAVHIQTSGSFLIRDPLVFAASKVPAISQTFLPWAGQYLPGYYLSGDVIIPQFYHAYPALLAFAGSIANFKAALYVTPLLALLNAMGLFLLGRRWWSGTAAAVLSALLLASNVSFVWFARYADSEMLALQFYLSGLFALHLAEESNTSRATRGWCVLSACFLGAAFLTRMTMVFLFPALALGWLMFVWRDKFRFAVTWILTLGVFILWTFIHVYFFSFPYFHDVFYQGAIVPLMRSHRLPLLVAIIGATVLFLVLTWGLKSSSPVRDKIAPWIRKGQSLIFPATVLPLLGMAACYYFFHWHILIWMAWYCGVPALAMLFVGAASWAKEATKGLHVPVSLAIFIFAGLTTIVVLGPNPMVDTRQFWASRRLLVFVFPLVALFAARGLAEGARWVGRMGSIVLLSIVLMPGIHNIRPLLHFTMYRSASQDLQRLAEHIPRDAIVLCGPTGEWKIPTPLRFFYGRHAFGFRQGVLTAEVLDSLTKTFPGHELDLVTVAPQLPLIELPYGLKNDPVISIPINWEEFNEPKDGLPRRFHTIRGNLELWKIQKRRPDSFFEATAVRLETSGVKVRGLYGADPGKSYRWTNGQAELVIPRGAVKDSRVLYIDLSDNRPQPADTHVLLNSKEIGSVQVERGRVTTFSYHLPANWLSGSGDPKIELRTPTWSPAKVLGSEDTRGLGVMLLNVGFLK